MPECYVIYAKQLNKQTGCFEDVTIMACASTEKNAQEILRHLAKRYKSKWLNEIQFCIDDESCPQWIVFTYQKAINMTGGI